MFKDKYKYYNNNNYWNYEIELKKDSWNQVEMVSVDKNDKVIGYLCAYFERSSNKVSGMAAINFQDVSLTFSKDFYKFLTGLFEVHNANKIEWTVVVGNPAEKLYDKFINRFGGMVVGINHETTILGDGKLYDMKEYEIFKRDYNKYKTNKREK